MSYLLAVKFILYFYVPCIKMLKNRLAYEYYQAGQAYTKCKVVFACSYGDE